MKLFKTYVYEYPSKIKPIDIFNTVFAAIPEKAQPQILFSFTESNYNKVRAVDRLIKSFPQLEKFKSMAREKVEGRASQLVTNFDSENKKMIGQIDVEVLREIFAGIPRRFPVHCARLEICGLKELNQTGARDVDFSIFELNESGTLSSPQSPCISLVSDWWTPGRTNSVVVQSQHILPPHDMDKVPEIEGLSQILEKIGKFRNSYLTIGRDTREKEAILESKVKVDELKNKIQSKISMVYFKLPNTLKTDYKLDREYQPPISFKNSLKKVFGKLSYKYQPSKSGSGVYYLSKRTIYNNQITLKCDLTPIVKYASCDFVINGLGWGNSIAIKAGGQTEAQGIQISSQVDVEKYIENLAIIVDFLEKEYVHGIENIYGSSPKWFAS